MKITKKSIDLHWCQEGDFKLGANGDIQKATADGGRVAKQTIIKRLQSSRGDWVMSPEFGASLDSFAGLPNTRETGERIKSVVKSVLMAEGVISPESLVVEVVPSALTRVTVLIYGKIIASNVPLYVQIEYDLRENRLIPRLV
jgi:phage baseplate assembly protein W